jgi:hypothetical protein
MEFEEGVDPEKYKFTSDLDRVLCSRRFSVFVKTGDIVPSGSEVDDFYIPVYADQDAMHIDLYVSDSRNPRYVTDDGCVRVGRIRVELKKVMRFAMEDRGVNVHMGFGETEVKVRAVVKKSGEEAAATIDFLSDY